MRTLEQRFWSKVDRREDCWEWTGGLNKWGYGEFWAPPTMRGAHRVSWELANGAIPRGLFVCHLCDNRKCVRPSHLFLGTASDNTRDMILKGRSAQQRCTHCPRGHAYDAENTRVNKKGQRSCRACRRAKSHEYNARQWAKYLAEVADGTRGKISRATGRPFGAHNAAKTHCKFGHPFDEANTYHASNGARGCRTCVRERASARYHARKGAERHHAATTF